MTDTEKLRVYATEVSKMLTAQNEYYATSRDARNGKAAPDEVRTALDKAKKRTDRVRNLTEKLLNAQQQVFT